MYHEDPPAEPGAAAMTPTPECSDGDDPTPRQGAGPFYTPDTPHRASLLEPGLRGTPLVLVGYVLRTNCQPLANVLLDFWQSNSEGRYDNQGYILRGHQFTDASGQYRLETIVPGLYPGRHPPHPRPPAGRPTPAPSPPSSTSPASPRTSAISSTTRSCWCGPLTPPQSVQRRSSILFSGDDPANDTLVRPLGRWGAPQPGRARCVFDDLRSTELRRQLHGQLENSA